MRQTIHRILTLVLLLIVVGGTLSGCIFVPFGPPGPFGPCGPGCVGPGPFAPGPGPVPFAPGPRPGFPGRP